MSLDLFQWAIVGLLGLIVISIWILGGDIYNRLRSIDKNIEELMFIEQQRDAYVMHSKSFDDEPEPRSVEKCIPWPSWISDNENEKKP